MNLRQGFSVVYPYRIGRTLHNNASKIRWYRYGMLNTVTEHCTRVRSFNAVKYRAVDILRIPLIHDCRRVVIVKRRTANYRIRPSVKPSPCNNEFSPACTCSVVGWSYIIYYACVKTCVSSSTDRPQSCTLPSVTSSLAMMS